MLFGRFPVPSLASKKKPFCSPSKKILFVFCFCGAFDLVFVFSLCFCGGGAFDLMFMNLRGIVFVVFSLCCGFDVSLS